jgi:salicylate hydroxylase
MPDQIHVAIIGAGLGGLAAAIGISRAGHRVTILEQAEELGEVLFPSYYNALLL